MIKLRNIFSEIPKDLPEELIETLEKKDNIKIERIISKGHITKKERWYDQDKNEFVLVIKGNSIILFEDNEEIKMTEGDYIIIPKRIKHKVIYTDKNKDTIWLTIFY